MAIIASDIKFYLSGGGSNTDPNAALGGAISSTEVVNATLRNLFGKVTGAESTAGVTKYRCFYVKNTHGTLTWQTAKIYIGTNTPSTDTTCEIAIGSASLSATEQTVANETTAPTGVSFSTAAGSGNALTIGDMAAGAYRSVWVKLIVTAGAAPYDVDSVVITGTGDTAA